MTQALDLQLECPQKYKFLHQEKKVIKKTASIYI